MITTIGRHRVRHGNVMDGLDDLLRGEKATIFYSDPPWGQGNLNYWSTINKRMAGEQVQQPALTAFLHQIAALAARHTTHVVMIEYGIQWEHQLKAVTDEHALRHLGTATTQYATGGKLRPLHLHAFAPPGSTFTLPPDYLGSLEGTHGYATTRAVIGALTRAGLTGILLDPCCGLGLQARAAVEHGLTFRGNELNAARLAKTIIRLKADQ